MRKNFTKLFEAASNLQHETFEIEISIKVKRIRKKNRNLVAKFTCNCLVDFSVSVRLLNILARNVCYLIFPYIDGRLKNRFNLHHQIIIIELIFNYVLVQIRD